MIDLFKPLTLVNEKLIKWWSVSLFFLFSGISPLVDFMTFADQSHESQVNIFFSCTFHIVNMLQSACQSKQEIILLKIVF